MIDTNVKPDIKNKEKLPTELQDSKIIVLVEIDKTASDGDSVIY